MKKIIFFLLTLISFVGFSQSIPNVAFPTTEPVSDAYAVNITNYGTSYNNKVFFVEFRTANSGPATLNVTPSGGSALGAKHLRKFDGADWVELSSGDIPGDTVLWICHYHNASGTIQIMKQGSGSGGGAGLVDGDYGDITVSGTGTVMTIDNLAVTNAKINDVAVGKITGLGTGVASALGNNIGSAGAPVLFNGALGTPSSGTLTNGTGLPISTGVSGLGTGVATFLGTPSSSNLASAVTGETGSGAVMFGTSPDITTGFTIGTAAGSRKIVVGDGTKFAASTETWAVPGTSGNILQSDGTNWTSASASTGAAFTKTDDTNVTATLGGNNTTALVNTMSLTLGWTGQLGVTRGGTGLSTVTTGDLIQGTASNTLSVLASSTAGKWLRAGGASTASAWSTTILPNSATANRLLYATSTNTWGESANLTYDGTLFTANGGSAFAYAAKTTTYTLTSGDRFIECTSGSFTVTLPTAVGRTGIIYTIDNSGAGTITLATTSSQTIDGASPGTLTAGQKITIYSNGANWRTF